MGASCKSRGSCAARVFNMWGERLVQVADQEAQAQLAFSMFGVRAWFKLQINRLKPNSRFQRRGRGLGARYRSRGSGPTRVVNVWGGGGSGPTCVSSVWCEGLVQAVDQEARAQLASSTDGMRAWCKVQIKRLRPNSRFQPLGRGLGASCKSRGSGPTRVFTVWCEGLVQAAGQEAQAQLAFSADGMRAWCKVQIKRLRPNSRFHHLG